MKKILLVALAAAAMVSCSQNEEIENAAQKAEINFETVVRVGTKAAIVTTESLNTFTVNGYKTVQAMDGSVQLATGFMDNQTLTKGTDWKLSSPFYWPSSGYVQFFATSPKQDLSLPVGYPTFDYTVKSIANQEDLIAAFVNDQSKTTDAITLPFKHLLTQVNFSIKGDTKDFTYKVTELVIKGMKDKATFVFSATDSLGSWTNLSVSTSDIKYTYSNSDPGVTVTPVSEDLSEVTNFDTTDALFMLLPQNLTNVVSLDITYSAAHKDKLSEPTFNGTKNVKLTGTWGMSKNVRYTLVLKSDASPINLTPSVGGWTNGTGTIEPEPAS